MGSILVLLTIVPFAGPFLGIVGFILVLIATNYLSDLLNDRSIFNNMLIAVLLGIAGVAVGALLGLTSLAGIPMGWTTAEDQVGILATALTILVVIWIFMIISAIFLRRSFNSLATALNVRLFGTAALLYLIGAVLVIAIGIGFILIFVAEILQAVAFFSIPEQRPGAAPQPPSATTP